MNKTDPAFSKLTAGNDCDIGHDQVINTPRDLEIMNGPLPEHREMNCRWEKWEEGRPKGGINKSLCAQGREK